MKYTYPKNIKTPSQRKAYRVKVRREQDAHIGEIEELLVDASYNCISFKLAYRKIRDRFIITRR